VGVTLGRGQGTDEVDVDVGKMAGRNRNGSGQRRDMCMNFGSLARNTLFGPGVDVLGHTMPEETGSN
jgi:hypothetical protein